MTRVAIKLTAAPMKGPYTWSHKSTAKNPEDSILYVANGDGFIVCEAYGESCARKITEILNRDWIADMQRPTIKIIRAGVRLNGRAATTSKAKTGGTRKRRAAKSDNGTAKERAAGGSTPPPGSSRKLTIKRYF